ncbi:helix-turn-helix transcriptional regulator (plasmid) [Streptomyces sp. NBC_01281]|uniref:helix-turn-helix domain-containing protein n=1 Tax=Streptomyces sp. NBC_01281 TaxID=2903811 RepID=UPI002E1203C1|nr:helix-turn-helix transcriptional regulator [Streptomyces sp. NBC_01281]
MRSLALEMRTLRKDSGLTIHELAKKSGYSTAALSGATAGRTVPSWELVQAFVMSCGYDGDMDRWKRAHRAARRDMQGPVSSEDTGEHQIPRGPLAFLRSSAPKPASAPLVPAPAAQQPDGLLALVQQARSFERRDRRVSSVTSADYMHTALALCTTPEDVIELMNELVRDKGLSIPELEERSRKHYRISNNTFMHVLAGNQLPTTELLYIFLSACGLEEERTVMWHFTVTRIRISQMRQAQMQQAERVPVKKPRLRRRKLAERAVLPRVSPGNSKRSLVLSTSTVGQPTRMLTVSMAWMMLMVTGAVTYFSTLIR